MLRSSLASPVLNWETATYCCISFLDTTTAPNLTTLKQNSSRGAIQNAVRARTWASACPPKKWGLHSTAQTQTLILSDEEREMWDASKQALSAFKFSVEEEDKILAKAFGHVHSPYWSEERPKEVPKHESVKEKLDFLRGLGLSDDDLCKVLKKFPEVLGCSLDEELRNNVQVLNKDWGIEGKTLRSLLLRNPKVLGYNVDCKGDCMAKCTRCWVRF